MPPRSSLGQGRVAHRHRAHAGGAGRRDAGRAPCRGAAPRSSPPSTSAASVVNAGDGWHAHPTQALLDLFTLRQALGEERVAGRQGVHRGRRAALAGRALQHLVADRWGVDLWLTGPAVFLRGFEPWARALPADRRLTVTGDLPTGIKGAAAVMALRVQRERLEGAGAPSEAAYAARWGLTEERLRATRPDAIVMHPGPSTRAWSCRRTWSSGPRSVITRQVANGVRGAHGGHGAAGRDAMSSVTGAMSWRRPGGRASADLAIEDAWLVDPASGRSGPGSLRDRGRPHHGGRVGAAGGRATAPPRRRSWSRPASSTCTRTSGSPAARRRRRSRPGSRRPRTAASPSCAPCPTRARAVDRPEVVQRVRAAAAAARIRGAGTPWGAMTVGREGTTLAPLASLAAAGVVGFSDAARRHHRPGAAARRADRGRRPGPARRGPRRRAVAHRAARRRTRACPRRSWGCAARPPRPRSAPCRARWRSSARCSAESPPDVRPHLHLAHLSVGAGPWTRSGAPARRACASPATCPPHHLALHDGWPGGDRRWSWDAAAEPWAGARAGDAAPYDPSTRVGPAAPGAGGRHRAARGARGRHHRCHRERPRAGARRGQGACRSGRRCPGISGLETTLGLVLEAVAAGRLGLVRAHPGAVAGSVARPRWRAAGVPEPPARGPRRPRGVRPGRALGRGCGFAPEPGSEHAPARTWPAGSRPVHDRPWACRPGRADPGLIGRQAEARRRRSARCRRGGADQPSPTRTWGVARLTDDRVRR